MRRHPAIAAFLLMVLLSTVLPMREVGRLLSSNQLTEECNETLTDNGPTDKDKVVPLNTMHNLLAKAPAVALNQEAGLAFSGCSLPMQPLLDRLVPPPNYNKG